MEIQRLDIEDWRRLKQLRLAALKDAPQAFDSTHEDAQQFTKEDWCRQIEELATFVAVDDRKDVGMVRGVPSDTETSSAFLISLWIAPESRGTGAGEKLIGAVINWARQSGFTRMERVNKTIGNAPCYLSFDIDSLDPSVAPGTGTPEVGGLITPQALEIIRGCAGLNIVGADLVEVSPPYDLGGSTALIGANLLYEMLCVLPQAGSACK